MRPFITDTNFIGAATNTLVIRGSSSGGAGGTFTNAAALSVGREYHTATVLTNGRVLVAGGLDNSYFATASAALFVPASLLWQMASNLITARAYHTATLLANGKVLVTGGVNSSCISSAELYDPTSGTWAFTGSLTNARAYHTASLLTNGSVLAVGGDNGSFIGMTSAEIYTPPATTISTNFNRLAVTTISGGNVRLSFVGTAGTNYALERTFRLSPANWISLQTNPAGSDGTVTFTNAPNTATNYFWRIRSVP